MGLDVPPLLPWTCPTCRTRVEANLGVCWRCGTSKEGVPDPGFRAVDDVPPEELTGALSAYDAFDQALHPDATLPDAEGDEDAADGGPSSGCPRCGGVLAFAGTQRFDPPIGWTVSVERGERRVEHERFDVYACRRCGHLEFGLARDRGGPSGRV